jgi:hypothetical protein
MYRQLMQPILGAITMKGVFRGHETPQRRFTWALRKHAKFTETKARQELSRPSGTKQVSALWLNLVFCAGEGIAVPPLAGRVFHSR